MDKSERYLKEIAKSLLTVEKNIVEIAKELKKLNRKSQHEVTGDER